MFVRNRRQRVLGGSLKLRRWAVCAAWALASAGLLPATAWSQQEAAPALPAASAPAAESAVQVRPDVPLKRVDFREAAVSDEARALAQWAVNSGDHGNFPFIIVDKVQAQVFVFDNAGVLRGATPALLGTAVGDDSVPGIGQRPLSSIRPHERTTPAGRFMAYLDRDIHGEEVLWVDYDTAFSLHRMPKGHPRERRAERMSTPTPADNRITYGCINVSVPFYEKVVSPLLQKTQGVVYVLPETRPARVVFGSAALDGTPTLPATATAAPATTTSTATAAPMVSQPTRTVSSDAPLLTR